MAKNYLITDELLDGIWRGYFQFHNKDQWQEDEESKLEDKKFDFQLNFKSDDEIFTGVITEENTHFDKPITVKGFFHKRFISFEKFYPYLWMMDEKGKDVFNKSKPHFKIYYFGYLKPDTQQLIGDWEMPVEIYRYFYGASVEKYYTGKWELQKVE